ncbi:MAG TPA: transcription-repair coupling factor, partial [Atopobiaceae bacterium]|nr:transcription-repair coupling factor [Atopobiaceae bacterium]
MIINRVADQLLGIPELEPLIHALDAGDDAGLFIAQSARQLMLAALWARNPRPTIMIVSGEEAADRAARALAAWLGPQNVNRFPERRDRPWSETEPDDAVIAARCRALSRLAAGEKCVVVASARALLRRVPPVGSGYFAGSTFTVGDEIPFEDMGALLVGMGYTDAGAVDAPGSFHIHGDTVDVFPAQASSPVRIEFFGDEIDRVRRMVPSTG